MKSYEISALAFFILVVICTLLFSCKHTAPAPEPLNQCQIECLNEYGSCQNYLRVDQCEEPFQGCMKKC